MFGNPKSPRENGDLALHLSVSSLVVTVEFMKSSVFYTGYFHSFKFSAVNGFKILL